MAEATLNDVTKGLQQVSEAIREQTIADGKADPAKFLKEEFVSVLSQRRFSKKSIQQGDKIEKAEVKRTKREEDSNKKDLGHYKKQSFFQKMSNKLLGGIDDDIVKEKLDSFKQRLDMTEALEKLVSFAQGSSDLLKKQNFLEARKSIREKLSAAANTKLVKSIQSGFRRLGNGIKRIGRGISKVAGALFDKAKSAAKSGLSFLGKLALGGALLFLINFMKGEDFKKILNYIRNDILPYIADFYTNFLVPLGKNLKKLVGDVMKDFQKFLKGDITFGNTVQLGKDLGDSFLKFAARVLGYDSKDSMFAALSGTVERLKKAMANMMIDAVNKVIGQINKQKGLPDFMKISELKRIGEKKQSTVLRPTVFRQTQAEIDKGEQYMIPALEQINKRFGKDFKSVPEALAFAKAEEEKQKRIAKEIQALPSSLKKFFLGDPERDALLKKQGASQTISQTIRGTIDTAKDRADTAVVAQAKGIKRFEKVTKEIAKLQSVLETAQAKKAGALKVSGKESADFKRAQASEQFIINKIMELNRQIKRTGQYSGSIVNAPNNINAPSSKTINLSGGLGTLTHGSAVVNELTRAAGTGGVGH